MAEVFSIQALQEEAENKYPGLRLELADGKIVTFKNLLRLSDTAQKNATILIDSIKDTGDGTTTEQLEHQKQVIRDLFMLISDDPKAARDEVASWDLAMLLLVMEKWQAETELPEADGSPS